MDTKAYFESLTAEMSAVKDRIRNLIGSKYWPGDGQWKESVLRSVLRRYLPISFEVGSGFVISEDGVSTQIDVLVYDSSGPVLFRDGDFVILTPDVVAAVIEVKTRVRSSDLRPILEKLDETARFLRKQPKHPKPFIGLFSFEDEPINSQTLLRTLRDVNGGFGNYEIQCIALGQYQFVRFWDFSPSAGRRRYKKWHAYDLDGNAPGYFVHNVIEHLFPNSVLANNSVWYPAEGKELRKVDEIQKENGQRSAPPDR